MDKNKLFSATAKRLTVGSKGNRSKLILDDIELSEYLKEKISELTVSKKEDGTIKILTLHDIIRNKRIEVSLK